MIDDIVSSPLEFDLPDVGTDLLDTSANLFELPAGDPLLDVFLKTPVWELSTVSGSGSALGTGTASAQGVGISLAQGEASGSGSTTGAGRAFGAAGGTALGVGVAEAEGLGVALGAGSTTGEGAADAEGRISTIPTRFFTIEAEDREATVLAVGSVQEVESEQRTQEVARETEHGGSVTIEVEDRETIIDLEVREATCR